MEKIAIVIALIPGKRRKENFGESKISNLTYIYVGSSGSTAYYLLILLTILPFGFNNLTQCAACSLFPIVVRKIRSSSKSTAKKKILKKISSMQCYDWMTTSKITRAVVLLFTLCILYHVQCSLLPLPFHPTRYHLIYKTIKCTTYPAQCKQYSTTIRIWTIFDDDFLKIPNCWPMGNNVTLFVWQETGCFFFANESHTYYYLPVFFHAFDNIHKFTFTMDFIYFPHFDEIVLVHFRSMTFSIDVLPLGSDQLCLSG